MAGTAWREDPDDWLEPCPEAVGHRRRRRWAPQVGAPVRCVQGLLGPGERKSVQPVAARLGRNGHDQLHHCIGSPARDDAPLRRVLVEQADALVGGPEAVPVVDDTALAKRGRMNA